MIFLDIEFEVGDRKGTKRRGTQAEHMNDVQQFEATHAAPPRCYAYHQERYSVRMRIVRMLDVSLLETSL